MKVSVKEASCSSRKSHFDTVSTEALQNIAENVIAKESKQYAIDEASIVRSIHHVKGQLLAMGLERLTHSKGMILINSGMTDISDITNSKADSETALHEAECRRSEVTSRLDHIERQFKNIEMAVRSEKIVEVDRLQKELNSVLASRRQVMCELRRLAVDIGQAEVRRDMLLADMDSRSREQVELVLQKEDLENTLERLGNAGDTCFIIISQQQELEKKMMACQGTLEDLKNREIHLSDSISDCSDALKRGETEYRSIKSRINAGLKLRDEKMKRIKRELEIVLEYFSNAFAMDKIRDSSMEISLRETVSHIGRGIEISVLEEQIQIVCEEEQTLTNSLWSRLKDLKEGILEKSTELEQEDKLYSTSTDIESRISNFRSQYQKKLDTLADWKLNLKSILKNNASQSAYLDTYALFQQGELAYSIRKEFSRKINWTEAYQKMLDSLLNLLEAYGDAAGQKGKEFLKEKRYMEEVQVRNMELSCQKALLSFLEDNIHKKTSDIFLEVSMLESELSDSKAILDSEISQMVNEKVDMRECEIAGELKIVHRTYGTKAMEKMKIEEKSEIIKAVIAEKKQELEEMANLQRSLDKYEARIHRLRVAAQEDILPHILEIESQISESINSRSHLMARDRSLLYSEEELVHSISSIEHRDKMLIAKKIDGMKNIKNEYDALCAEKDRLDVKIEDLKNSILGYEREIQRFNQTVDDIDAREYVLQKELRAIEEGRRSKSRKHQEVCEDIKERLRSLSRGDKGPLTECKYISKNCNSNQVVIADFTMKKKSKIFNSEESKQKKYPMVAEFILSAKEEKSNKDSDDALASNLGLPPTGNIHQVETRKNSQRKIRSILKPRQSDADLSNYRSNETVAIDLGPHHRRYESNLPTISQAECSTDQEFSEKPRNNLDESINNPVSILIKPSQGLTTVKNSPKQRGDIKDDTYYASSRYGIVKNDKCVMHCAKSKSYDFGSSEALQHALKRLKLVESNKENTKPNTSYQRSRMEDSMRTDKSLLIFTGARKGLTVLQQSHFINKRKAELPKETRIESLFHQNSVKTRPSSKRPSHKRSSSRLDQDKENIRPSMNLTNKLRSSLFLESGKMSSLLSNSKAFEKDSSINWNSRSRDFSREGTDLQVRGCLDPVECRKHAKYFRINSPSMSAEEIEMFQTLKPLLEGVHLYRKFITTTMRKSTFDPLKGKERPPELFGYGLRMIRLNLAKKSLEILTTPKLSVEKSLPLTSLLKVSTTQWDQIKKEDRHIAEFVPLEIVTKEGILDLVAISLGDASIWRKGISRLISCEKEASKLASKVQCLCV